MNFLSSLTITALVFGCVSAAIDHTLVSKAIGEDVVDVSVTRFNEVFGYDYRFMKRVAYMASNFGSDNNTFPSDFFGGIWQLPEEEFNSTAEINPILGPYKDSMSKFGVDYYSARWDNLTKPLYSCMATGLYLKLQGSIPPTLEEQAVFWDTHLNNDTSIGPDDFIEAIEAYENATVTPCDAPIDIVAVLDGSTSTGQSLFNSSKSFISDLFKSLYADTVRMGLVVFSNETTTQFDLGKNFASVNELVQEVQRAPYLDERSRIDAGVQEAVKMFNIYSNSDKTKLMVVFTDGDYNEGSGIPSIEAAKAAGIKSFAVGISHYINSVLQTITYGNVAHIFKLDMFNELLYYFPYVHQEMCDVFEELKANYTEEVTLAGGEKRMYQFNGLPAEGLTISLGIDAGSVVGYWAYGDTTKYPNSAFHDGPLRLNMDLKTFVPNLWANSTQKHDLYFMILGQENANRFNISLEVGNFAQPEPTQATTSTPAWVWETTTKGTGTVPLVNAIALFLIPVFAYLPTSY